MLGLPMNPEEKGAGRVEDTKWQVLSTSQELRRAASSDGPRMLVRVTTFEMTSSLLLMRVVEALKKVVK